MANVQFTAAEIASLATALKPAVTAQVNAAVNAAIAAYLAGPTAPPVVTPPDTTPPASGVLWLYKAGVFAGAGDYSYGNGGKVTYDTSTVVVTGDEAWQPRMPNDHLDMAPYKYVLVSIKPSEKHSWITGMESIGDVAIPGNHGPVDITPYALGPVAVGQWTDYKIPLSAYGTMPFVAYKIMFQAQNVPNPSTNRQEFDKVGFSAT